MLTRTGTRETVWKLSRSNILLHRDSGLIIIRGGPWTRVLCQFAIINDWKRVSSWLCCGHMQSTLLSVLPLLGLLLPLICPACRLAVDPPRELRTTMPEQVLVLPQLPQLSRGGATSGTANATSARVGRTAAWRGVAGRGREWRARS